MRGRDGGVSGKPLSLPRIARELLQNAGSPYSWLRSCLLRHHCYRPIHHPIEF